MVREFCYLVSKDRIVGLVLAASLIHTRTYTLIRTTHTHTHTNTQTHTDMDIEN